VTGPATQLRKDTVSVFLKELSPEAPSFSLQADIGQYGGQVRFGSKADIGQCRADVRFTPESGHQVDMGLSLGALAMSKRSIALLAR